MAYEERVKNSEQSYRVAAGSNAAPRPNPTAPAGEMTIICISSLPAREP